MNNDRLADVFYTILRNETLIDRNTVKEMTDNGIIVSHRDFLYTESKDLIQKAAAFIQLHSAKKRRIYPGIMLPWRLRKNS